MVILYWLIRNIFNKWLKLFITLLIVSGCVENIINDNSLEIFPYYKDSDLGLRYTPEKSVFRVWTPVSSRVRLKIYKEAKGGIPLAVYSMARHKDGTWIYSVSEDLDGKYYTFQAEIDGVYKKEVPDPYAYAVGINGNRSAIIDLSRTNPPGWHQDAKPKLSSFNDIILYELHIRDLSIDPASGIVNKGKYVGLTESGTRGPQNVITGLDHLQELGITHLHLLPSFDFASIDESASAYSYNWGYDPKNYNVPEGSYATDAADPAIRIREFKEMVKKLHQKGIRVVMDVVYNHTFETDNHPFNELMPDYFYRQNPNGTYSNASGCGNEIASERLMVRKYIIESVSFWAREYHIDGFRFDLMGIMDIETMAGIRQAINKIDTSIFLYGEGWTAGSSPFPAKKRALKNNMTHLPGISAFCDEMRDGIKGPWDQHKEKGFASGKTGLEEDVKFGIVGAIYHPQIDYKKTSNTYTWANQPEQCINYVSCHDDLTLWDKIALANPHETEENLIKMNLLSNTIVLISQGIPFLHAGVEFLRTKYGDSNSYRSPDSVNQMDWSRKAKYLKIHNFHRDLIALRKAHPAFRMTNSEMIRSNLYFLETGNDNLIGYRLYGRPSGDSWQNILVFLNGNSHFKELIIPAGPWRLALLGDRIYNKGEEIILSEKIKVPGYGAIILYRDDDPFKEL
ncbi:type I pullulanase [soil metagenome]